MLCRQAGISTIAAYCRENPYGLLSDWFPDKEPLFEIKHEVQRQLDLAKSLGAEYSSDKISIHISEETEKKSLKILKEEGLISNGKYIVIHPGVSEKRRQFPLEILAEATETIHRKTDLQIVLTGLQNETDLTDFINEKLGGFAIDLTGKLKVEELASVIKNAELIISNNTGPVHLAAATQTPVLVLYALTNPQHLPWQTNHMALPFEVPAEMRSKNVIIEFAYQKAFKDKAPVLKARDVANACFALLEMSDKKEKTDILSL
jgi:ADP-heptose:LPS heptosyltransferase